MNMKKFIALVFYFFPVYKRGQQASRQPDPRTNEQVMLDIILMKNIKRESSLWSKKRSFGGGIPLRKA